MAGNSFDEKGIRITEMTISGNDDALQTSWDKAKWNSVDDDNINESNYPRDNSKYDQISLEFGRIRTFKVTYEP